MLEFLCELDYQGLRPLRSEVLNKLTLMLAKDRGISARVVKKEVINVSSRLLTVEWGL